MSRTVFKADVETPGAGTQQDAATVKAAFADTPSGKAATHARNTFGALGVFGAVFWALYPAVLVVATILFVTNGQGAGA
jgi:hypothetical protein